MKYSFFLLLITVFLFQACNSDDNLSTSCVECEFTCLDFSESSIFTNDCGNNWNCAFNLYPQSTVDITESSGFTLGGKKVFTMVNSTQGSLQVADDELENTIVFELGNLQNDFSLENEELAQINLHFKRVCFCSETNFMAVTVGCMQGEEQDDGTWFIQGNLTVPYSFGDVNVRFDARFGQ